MKAAILLSIIVFTAGTGWWFSKDHLKGAEHTHTQEAKKTKNIYTCPMHPHVKSDKPGSCPICGMDLVIAESPKVFEAVENTDQAEHAMNIKKDHSPDSEPKSRLNLGEPTGHVGFNLTMKKQQMIGVKVAKVEKKNLFKSISVPGRIAFDPELYTVQSEYLEALKQWHRVKNSPIADVRENTRQMINSTKIRLRVLGLSDGQIKSLARKGRQSEGLLVTGKGQDNWIYADVYEVDLPFIKKGLSTKVTANFLQGVVLPGKVISVDQVISPDTRTAKVRIQLLKSNTSIRPESYVNVTIFAPVGEHLSVPLEAIMDTGKETYVFVKSGKGNFEPRKVNIILETDTEAALAGGVAVGEEIVVGGNFMLDSESRLRSVIQGSSTTGGHNHE